MKLDWVPATKSFVLLVPRDSGNLQGLMREHGLDFSLADSTDKTGVLFTHEPYAAASFVDVATPAAREQLKGITDEIARSWALDSSRHIAVPEGQELWPFQKASIDYALSRTHTLVGDQPGLGKTPIAIAFANEIQAERCVVVCPASIRGQWVKRIREWTTMRWPYLIHPIFSSRNGVNPYAQWIVLSYELARTPAINAALASAQYDVLILDEGHYLKTIDSRRTRAIFGGGHETGLEPLAARASRILALTGTPLPNRPREAYTLARGLCFDAIDWMSEDVFRYRFNPSIRGVTPDGRVYTDERTGRHGELQSRLRANFMVRHLKRDVMPWLHPPVYDVIQLEETAAIRQALEAESLLEIDPDNYDTEIDLFGGNVAEARHMMGVAMAPQIADYVDMLIDGGEEKLVVFAWHIDVMDYLQERWAKHGVVRVDGSTSAKRKDQRVNEFVVNPRCNIILGNLLSLGTGTDGLQKVSAHALIAEADWTPGNNIQAFERLDRGGQERKVQGDIFVAPGSLSEKILGRALEKLQTTHKALDRRSGT